LPKVVTFAAEPLITWEEVLAEFTWQFWAKVGAINEIKIPKTLKVAVITANIWILCMLT